MTTSFDTTSGSVKKPGRRMRFLGIVLFFIGLFSGAASARAQIFGSVVVDLPGLKVVQGSSCKDPNTCPGACGCYLKFYSKEYSWTAYNFYEAMDVVRDSSRQFNAQFNYSDKGCGIDFQPTIYGEEGNALKTKIQGMQNNGNLVGKCEYLDPFCCCRNDNGRLADCGRAVEYDNAYGNVTGADARANPVPKCGVYGSNFKPFTSKTYPQYADMLTSGKSCRVFQDTVNKAEDLKDEKKKASPSTQTSIDIKQQAASLKQSRFSSAEEVIAQLVKLLVSFIGSISLALYIGAGVIWMTSAGNAERIEKSRNIFVWTTLGVMVMLASYFIVKFLFATLNV